MRVLVCGSSGCIGSAVARALRWRGHRVVETSRRADAAGPTDDTVGLDLLQPTPPAVWAARLATLDIDAIVNCAGDPFAPPEACSARLHRDGPIAFFRGAAAAGVARIVQVSRLGLDPRDGGARRVDPAHQAADEMLLGLRVDAAVVRPSFVHGPASRTSARVARLARAPLIVVPHGDTRRIQPIHVFELAEALAALLERTGAARGVYELGGASLVGLRELLAAFRAAQGLGNAIWLPLPFAGAAARLARRIHPARPSDDRLRFVADAGVPRCNAAHVLLGRAPSSLAEILAVTPPPRASERRPAWAAIASPPRRSRGLP